MITYLLDCHNFDINEVDLKLCSAVHWAAYNSNEIAMSYLLSRKPKVNITDEKGLTPLHLAVVFSEQVTTTSLIRMLLMRGADPFLLDKKGRTPLDYAKIKIKDLEWRDNVCQLLSDTME